MVHHSITRNMKSVYQFEFLVLREFISVPNRLVRVHLEFWMRREPSKAFATIKKPSKTLQASKNNNTAKRNCAELLSWPCWHSLLVRPLYKRWGGRGEGVQLEDIEFYIGSGLSLETRVSTGKQFNNCFNAFCWSIDDPLWIARQYLPAFPRQPFWSMQVSAATVAYFSQPECFRC